MAAQKPTEYKFPMIWGIGVKPLKLFRITEVGKKLPDKIFKNTISAKKESNVILSNFNFINFWINFLKFAIKLLAEFFSQARWAQIPKGSKMKSKRIQTKDAEVK